MRMLETPGSALSRHDIEVISLEVAKAKAAGLSAREVHLSDRRLVVDNVRLFGGLAVRRRSDLNLNEGILICWGGDPVEFELEP